MCDVDMLFVDRIEQEVLGQLVAVRHQFTSVQPEAHWGYERNPKSTAFIPMGTGVAPYVGGFQGGERSSYLQAVEVMDDCVCKDDSRKIIAVWHDECHWNRYLVDHPPDVDLPPQYCNNEDFRLPGGKLLCLTKNHAWYRSV